MAGGNADRGGGSPIITQGHDPEKPKGLLDAIAELQYFHSQERGGMVLDGGLFTIKDTILFMELGFWGTFKSGLIMALFTPLTIGVLEKMIPIFGSLNPSAFDKFYVMLLSLMYLIGYGYFLGIGAKSFFSEYTHKMVTNLLQGIVCAALLKVGIVFLLFHSIYILVWTPEHLLRLVAFLTRYISIEHLAQPYKWLLDFRPVFISSAWFVVVTTVIWLAVIFGFYVWARIRNAKLREVE